MYILEVCYVGIGFWVLVLGFGQGENYFLYYLVVDGVGD
jgi:hypothetical protein